MQKFIIFAKNQERTEPVSGMLDTILKLAHINANIENLFRGEKMRIVDRMKEMFEEDIPENLPEVIEEMFEVFEGKKDAPEVEVKKRKRVKEEKGERVKEEKEGVKRREVRVNEKKERAKEKKEGKAYKVVINGAEIEVPEGFEVVMEGGKYVIREAKGVDTKKIDALEVLASSLEGMGMEVNRKAMKSYARRWLKLEYYMGILGGIFFLSVSVFAFYLAVFENEKSFILLASGFLFLSLLLFWHLVQVKKSLPSL